MSSSSASSVSPHSSAVAELTINLLVVLELNKQFTFLGHLASRFSTLFLAANRIRTFTSFLSTEAYTPSYTEGDYSESKGYVWRTSNS